VDPDRPLLVLGVLSAAGGLINLPELYHGNAWLHHWLEPVTRPSAPLLPVVHLSTGTEWLLVVLRSLSRSSASWAPGGCSKTERLVPARSAPEERGFQRVLRNKWYVDENL